MRFNIELKAHRTDGGGALYTVIFSGREVISDDEMDELPEWTERDLIEVNINGYSAAVRREDLKKVLGVL